MSALFLVVGNSASGKDTIIDYAISRISSLKKAKRHITREASKTEDFVSIKKEDFIKDDYALWWESYGKFYGVKEEEIIFQLMNGSSIMLNISRNVISQAKKLWEKSYVIEFKVPAELVKKRLLERKRESPEEIEIRVLRAMQKINAKPDIIIDSSSPNASIAGEKLTDFIKKRI